MTSLATIALLSSAFAAAAALAYWLSRPDSPFLVLDHPNHRSLHRRPIPRAGGLAVLGASMLCWAPLAAWRPMPTSATWVALGTFIVALISIADDIKSVRARYRFAVHVLAAFFLLMAQELTLPRLELPFVSLTLDPITGGTLTVLFVVWMTNMYNFMDGMDGFAGGMTIFGFGAMAVAFAMANEPTVALGAAIIAAAAGGFLCFNFPPARIFLGDGGAVPLGFLAGALGVLGVTRHAFPIWFPVLVFSPFFVDASSTVVHRLIRGEKIWLPHCRHMFQLLVRSGWSQRRTVLTEYALMFGAGMSGLALLRAPAMTQAVVITLWAAAYAGMMSYVVLRFLRVGQPLVAPAAAVVSESPVLEPLREAEKAFARRSTR